MSAENRTENTNEKSQALRRLFMQAYTVKELDDGQNPIWSRIGAAWQHKDGQGFDIRMDALPVDGRIVLRVPKDRDDGQSGEGHDRTPG